MLSITDALIERSGTHAAPSDALRPAQRFQEGVTELDVARIMHQLERGVTLHLSPTGRWAGPTGSRMGYRTSPIVQEMIRTGLVRHFRDRDGDHLIPAPVHLDLGDHRSACHFVGENLGPMRARLSGNLALVCCLACVDVVANGTR